MDTSAEGEKNELSMKGLANALPSEKKGGDIKGKPEPKPQRPWTDELEEDFQRILTVGEECISPEDLKKLLIAKGRGSDNQKFNLYDGFEPSGRMHIAQGVFKAMNVNKCTSPGTNSTFTFWVADWFALMNDKMGGDLEKIKIVGKYLIEVWKAAGMDLDNVIFKWASEEITTKADTYWPTMLDVARRFNVTRIKKCCQIMGRLEGSLTSAQVLYPLMQCTDVFFLKADICQLGVDQRKVNMLAREYCAAAGIKNKPIILSHHMLYGLKAGQEKMSKSDPDSAIFMEDSEEDVERKIMKAYCPNKEEEAVRTEDGDVDAGKESMHLVQDTLKNPCLDYIQNIILCPPGATFTVNGVTYAEFPPIREAFINGDITEEQLKRGLINELNKLLQPVRNHFNNDENAKSLLEQVQEFKRQGNAKVSENQIRRLDLVGLGKLEARCHAVFAPFPTLNPTLQQALETMEQLKSKGESSSGTSVLYIPDWTARVCNCCDADVKAIDSFYTIFVAALKALDANLMERVTVMKQSEAILFDPSNYWISVINVGRYFSLDDVMGSNVGDSDGVGIVIGRLMKIADVMGLGASSISMIENINSNVERELIEKYFDQVLSEKGLQKPSIHTLSVPSIALQEVESDAHKTENFEYYLLDDPKVHGKSKMKKAFCMPENITFCPPIVLANIFGPSEIVINRSEENGGNITYSNQFDMEDDFKSGSLHPGDLKATATTIMVEVLEKLSGSMKQDKSVSQAIKALKAFEKKMSKKKK